MSEEQRKSYSSVWLKCFFLGISWFIHVESMENYETTDLIIDFNNN